MLRVKLLDEWIFTSLIASSPVLETLKLEYVWGLEKLLMPNGLNSLRLLNLRYVQFGDEQALLNFIACCPLLETLELEYIHVLRKFRISNFLNLKKLEIFNCLDLEEIEIVAPKLRSFHLGRMRVRLDKKLSRLELVAPQLNVLEMRYSGLNMVDINTVVSKLQSLTSLTLEGSHELEEIELDASPCLHKFVLRCSKFFLLDSIKKCEIRSFAGTCRWEADFEMRPFRTWFASFRNFIARFSEFQTINFRCYYCPRSEGFASKMKDLDFATRSLEIQHLRIEPHFSSKVLLKMLLDGLFWTCRPRFLTMSQISYDSDKNLILSLNSLRSLRLHSVQFVHERIFANLLASCPLLQTLTLEYVRFRVDETMHRSLNSLRCLHLRNFDSRDLLNFIAHCPLLETLELRNFDGAISQWIEGVEGLRKLRISNLPNLKTLNVFNCRDVQEIEIAAPQLRSFRLRKALGVFEKKLSRLELIAPQLNVLKMINSGLNKVDLEEVVSKLRSLETLTIEGLFPMEKKIKLSGYKHDEIMLLMSKEFEEMELAAKSSYLQSCWD